MSGCRIADEIFRHPGHNPEPPEEQPQVAALPDSPYKGPVARKDCVVPGHSNTSDANSTVSCERKRKLKILNKKYASKAKIKNKENHSPAPKAESTPWISAQGLRKNVIKRIFVSEKKNTYLGVTKTYKCSTSRGDCCLHNKMNPLNYVPVPIEQLSKKIGTNVKSKKFLRKYFFKSEIILKSIKQSETPGWTTHKSVSHESVSLLQNKKITKKRKIIGDSTNKSLSSRSDVNNKNSHADSKTKCPGKVNWIVENKYRAQDNVRMWLKSNSSQINRINMFSLDYENNSRPKFSSKCKMRCEKPKKDKSMIGITAVISALKGIKVCSLYSKNDCSSQNSNSDKVRILAPCMRNTRSRAKQAMNDLVHYKANNQSSFCTPVPKYKRIAQVYNTNTPSSLFISRTRNLQSPLKLYTTPKISVCLCATCVCACKRQSSACPRKSSNNCQSGSNSLLDKIYINQTNKEHIASSHTPMNINKNSHLNDSNQTDDMKNFKVNKDLTIGYFSLIYTNTFSEPCPLSIVKPEKIIWSADKLKEDCIHFPKILENLKQKNEFYPCGINLEEYFTFFKSTRLQNKGKSLYDELYSFGWFSQIGDTNLTVCNLSTSSCVSIQSLDYPLTESQCSKSGTFTARSECSMAVPSDARKIYSQNLNPGFHNILVSFTEAMSSNPTSKSYFEHLNKISKNHSSSESSLSIASRSIPSSRSSNVLLKYLSLTNMITYRKYSKPEWRSKRPKYNRLNTVCTTRKNFQSMSNEKPQMQKNCSTFDVNAYTNGCAYAQAESLPKEKNKSIVAHDIHNLPYFKSEFNPKPKGPSENKERKLNECVINGKDSLASVGNQQFWKHPQTPLHEKFTVNSSRLDNVSFVVDNKIDKLNSKERIIKKIQKIGKLAADLGCEYNPTKCQYSNGGKNRKRSKEEDKNHDKIPQYPPRHNSKHIPLNSFVGHEKSARLYAKTRRRMKTTSNQCKIDSREGLNTNHASSITEKSKYFKKDIQYFNRKIDSYFTSEQQFFAPVCHSGPSRKENSDQTKKLKHENNKLYSNTKNRKKSKHTLSKPYKFAKKSSTKVFQPDAILKRKCCNGSDKLFADLIKGLFITDRSNYICKPECNNTFKTEKRIIQRLTSARAQFKLPETTANSQSEESESVSELEEDLDNCEKFPDNYFNDEIDHEETKNDSSSNEDRTSSDDSLGEEEAEEMYKTADIEIPLTLDEEIDTLPELTPKRASVRMFHKLHTLSSRIRPKRKKSGASTVSTMTNKPEVVIRPTRRRFFKTKYTNTKENGFPKMYISETSQHSVQTKDLQDGVQLTMEFPELKSCEPKIPSIIHKEDNYVDVGDLKCKCTQTDVNSCGCNQWMENLHKEIPICVANSVRQSLDPVLLQKKKPKVKSSEIQTMNLGLFNEYKITKEEHDDGVRLIVDIPKDPTQSEEDMKGGKSKKKDCRKKKDKPDPSEWNQINISCKFRSKSEKPDQSKGEGTRAKKSWMYRLFGRKKNEEKSSSKMHDMVECDSAIQLEQNHQELNIAGDHKNYIVKKTTIPHFRKSVINNYRVLTCDGVFQYYEEAFSGFAFNDSYVAYKRSVNHLRRRHYKRHLNNADEDDCVDNGESKHPSSTEVPAAANSGDDGAHKATTDHITESGYNMLQNLLTTVFHDIGQLNPDEQSPGCSYKYTVGSKSKTAVGGEVVKVLPNKNVKKKDNESSQEEVDLAKATKTNFQTPPTTGGLKHLHVKNNCSDDDGVNVNQGNVTLNTSSGLSLEDRLAYIPRQESVITIVIPYQVASNGAIDEQSGSEEYFIASNDDSSEANFGIEENIFPGWLLNILQNYQQIADTRDGAPVLIPLALPPPTSLRQCRGSGAGDGVGVHNVSSSSSSTVSSLMSMSDSDWSDDAQADSMDWQTLSSEDYQMLSEIADEEYQPAHSYQAMDTIASEEIQLDQFHTPTASDTCLSVQEPSVAHTMLLTGLRPDQQRGEHSSVSGIDGDISASDTEGQDNV